jgi:hypothetical protein
MPDDEPDPSIIEVLRREAFEEIGRMAFMAEDYAQKLFDATERRDLMAVAVRLQQLRFCAMAMIQTFNHFLRTQPHGQDVAGNAEPSHANRADQRAGDGVA